MNRRKIVYILILVSVISVACNKKREQLKDSIITNSISKFKVLEIDNKTLKFKRKDSIVDVFHTHNTYSYMGFNENKNTYTSFDIYVVKDNFYDLKNYTKTLLDSINYHHIELQDNNKDTLFYFQISKHVPQFKYFISGKYNFYHKYNLLNDKQKLLYEKYKDSLSKVRGNIRLFEGLEN